MTKFNEAWEHSPDTEIAGKIFDYLQTTGTEGGAVIPAPYRRGVSPLCRRCAQLKLSAPSLSFADTLAGLAEKKGRCALCALLYSSCVRPHESLPRKARVQFSRAGSYLTARREREEPQLVASLYRTRFGMSLAYCLTGTSTTRTPISHGLLLTYSRLFSPQRPGCPAGIS
jgi:hypothetical protein